MTNNGSATLAELLTPKRGVPPMAPEQSGLKTAPTLEISQSEDRASSLSARSNGGYYKALTVKVDKDRFTKLKNLGMRRDLRSQALITEALDLLFAKHQL